MSLCMDSWSWQTPKLVCSPTSVNLWVQTGAFSLMPSSSVWWWVLAAPQASRPVRTYENAVWVWCHLRISWSQLHIFRTFCFAHIATSLSCFHSINTLYESGFNCVYFIDFPTYVSKMCIFLVKSQIRNILKNRLEVDKLLVEFKLHIFFFCFF